MNLAYIGRVVEIDEIPGADRVGVLRVVCGKGGIWTGVAPKGAFSISDKCEVYVQDAVLPDKPRFDFIGKDKRIKMRRFLGVPSECLIVGLSEETEGMQVGDEISEVVGVTKYEKLLPAHLSGSAI